MQLCYNIEMSNIKDVVINRKVVYNKNNKSDTYELDSKRSKASTLENKEIPKTMSGDEMADYVRDFVGSKKWRIVMSLGTINIIRKKKNGDKRN